MTNNEEIANFLSSLTNDNAVTLDDSPVRLDVGASTWKYGHNMVEAQLAERSLPTPEILGLNLDSNNQIL